MKILFLDIDGVLNNTCPGTVCVKGKRLYDPHCISVLNNVLSDTNANIVISSAWRVGYSCDFLAGQLDMMGVCVQHYTVYKDKYAHRIVGVTDTNGPTRATEIVRWIEANQDKIDSYAIVDDNEDAMCDMTKCMFVQTADDTGLTREQGGRLIKLLNNMKKN